jgi:hypothetical protein
MAFDVHLMRCIPAVFWKTGWDLSVFFTSSKQTVLRGFPDRGMVNGAQFGRIFASLIKDLKMGVFLAIAVDSSIENILKFSEF